jgi:gluconate 2-dehydrogenase gamma chain
MRRTQYLLKGVLKMAEDVGRRNFLKQAVVGTAAAAAITPGVETVTAAAAPQAAPASAGYIYLNANEAAFLEAFVDMIVPADEFTPSGTDLGLATFIDRQLGGAWGKGDRLYMQGPWQQGSPGQGYQLPMTPAQFFRASIAAVNQHCKEANGKEFDRLPTADKQKIMEDLASGKITPGEISGRQFFDAAYQAVMEGMFADPIYGGNRDKAAWKMIGYPGVIAIHAQNIEKYRNKPYPVKPVSIADLM